MAAESGALRVVIAHARPGTASLVEVLVPAGSTLRAAIAASGLLSDAELESGALAVGVFNQLRPIDSPARDGDRIEIYRPLTVDPKEARRLRARIRRKRHGY
jgi:putative ubiquitin-RnfH superfamily antitoxin RatB of RatAB toxin-antitoxin module